MWGRFVPPSPPCPPGSSRELDGKGSQGLCPAPLGRGGAQPRGIVCIAPITTAAGGSQARRCRHGAHSPRFLHVVLPSRHVFGFYVEGGLPVLRPPVFLQRLLIDGRTPWRCPGCPCYHPWRSGCSVPPAPSSLASLGVAPSLWARRGGGRGNPAASEALPCSVLLTFPWLQGPMAELERLPFPCLRWVRRGVFSSRRGRNRSVGRGQHLGAPGHAEIPVAKGRIEQGAGHTARAGGQLPSLFPAMLGVLCPAVGHRCVGSWGSQD